MMIVVRTAGDPQSVVPAVREAARAIDPTVALQGVRPLTDLLVDMTAQRRLQHDSARSVRRGRRSARGRRHLRRARVLRRSAYAGTGRARRAGRVETQHSESGAARRARAGGDRAGGGTRRRVGADANHADAGLSGEVPSILRRSSRSQPWRPSSRSWPVSSPHGAPSASTEPGNGIMKAFRGSLISMICPTASPCTSTEPPPPSGMCRTAIRYSRSSPGSPQSEYCLVRPDGR